MENLERLENYFELANEALRCNNFQESIQYYNKIIEIDSRNYLAWFWKGVSIGRGLDFDTYNRLGEFKEYTEKGISLAPEAEKEVLKIKLAYEYNIIASNLLDSMHQIFISYITLDTFNKYWEFASNTLNMYLYAYDEYDSNNLELLKNYIEKMGRFLVRYKGVQEVYMNLDLFDNITESIKKVIEQIKLVESDYNYNIASYLNQDLYKDNTQEPSNSWIIYAIGAAVLFAVSLMFLFL